MYRLLRLLCVAAALRPAGGSRAERHTEDVVEGGTHAKHHGRRAAGERARSTGGRRRTSYRRMTGSDFDDASAQRGSRHKSRSSAAGSAGEVGQRAVLSNLEHASEQTRHRRHASRGGAAPSASGGQSIESLQNSQEFDTDSVSDDQDDVAGEQSSTLASKGGAAPYASGGKSIESLQKTEEFDVDYVSDDQDDVAGAQTLTLASSLHAATAEVNRTEKARAQAVERAGKAGRARSSLEKGLSSARGQKEAALKAQKDALLVVEMGEKKKKEAEEALRRAKAELKQAKHYEFKSRAKLVAAVANATDAELQAMQRLNQSIGEEKHARDEVTKAERVNEKAKARLHEQASREEEDTKTQVATAEHFRAEAKEKLHELDGDRSGDRSGCGLPYRPASLALALAVAAWGRL